MLNLDLRNLIIVGIFSIIHYRVCLIKLSLLIMLAVIDALV